MPTYEPTPAEHAELRRLLGNRFAVLGAPFQADNQVLGRRSTVGCVALEITQRCNLDCTLCYLSEYSESVPDPPLDEIKHKLDNIKRIFGVQTNVQITGGDPTLRKRDELVEIVRYCASIGLSPALFTNGIRASREMLQELRDVGLVDIAFHVDMTQERKGYTSEIALNEVREKYLERARGLGLAVIFNTTVHDENLAEIPALVRFFLRHAGELGMASFQMQADTGRGALRARGEELTKERLRWIITEACGTDLSWESVLIGHPKCHNIVYTLVAGDAVIDLFDGEDVVARWLRDFAPVPVDRTKPVQSAWALFKHIARSNPGWLLQNAPWMGRLLGKLVPALLRSRGKVGKLSFFIQNFQDAQHLDPERIDNCSFHVATRDGTVSMCEHNAKRDDYIIPPNLVRGKDIQPSRPPIAAVHAATRSAS
ncbi:MAG: radical SAM protein [Myxococcales bacterium]|nr:radical SAM protein [Myxococcales bacterium]